MGLFKRIAGFLGIAKDEAEEFKDDDHNDVVSRSTAAAEEPAAHNHLPRKGFSVPVHVPIDRPPPGPIVVPCTSGNGGVQGFGWYAKRLRLDEDGDIADEFIYEASPEKLMHVEDHHHKPLPRFEVKYSTRPVKMSNQARSHNGKIQFRVESQGRLEWM